MSRFILVTCEECGGSGEVEDEDHPGSGTLVCSDCDGTGEIEVEESDGQA